jgi:hypothetical protein
MPDGTLAIVCRGHGRGANKQYAKPCYCCETPSIFLCDRDSGGGKTCDNPICRQHSLQIGENKHLCVDCANTHAADIPKPELMLL